MLTAIVCIDKSNCIGVGDDIPWDCPSDRKFFKEYIKDKWKICGSRTWTSVSKYKWAKDVIVYGRTRFSLIYDDCIFNGEWTENPCEHLNRCTESPLDYVVIGGAAIYKLAAPYVQELIVTRIDRSTCNPSKAILFPWSSYWAYNWKEEIYQKLEEDVTVYRLTKT
jgi:dihydrofolate reductase